MVAARLRGLPGGMGFFLALSSEFCLKMPVKEIVIKVLP
jgi:hypothetical protein